MRPGSNDAWQRRFLTLVAAWTLALITDSFLAAPVAAGDWPQWRGPKRDGHAAPDESLPASLPDAPAARWRVPVGGAFASPIVVGNRLFLVDDQSGQETARALDTATGKELWRTTYAPTAGDEWGNGPRCTPLASDGRLYVQSLKGEFACLDQADGRRLWGFSFERDYGVEYVGGSDNPDAASRRRGHNGAPFVLGDRIYVVVGSTKGGTVVCFDKITGRELWKAGSDETAYAPLMAGTLAGRDLVVAYTAFSLLGLDAKQGEILWRIPIKTAANRHAVTPILFGDDIIVSSHTVGLRSFTVRASDRAVTCEPHWSQSSLKTSLATMVLVKGHLYGQGPDKNFVCVDAATGNPKWSQPGFGQQPLVAYAATIAAGDKLLVATDAGQLVLLRANPEKYEELGRQQVCGKTWSHPALAGGRLFLRDQRELIALDVKP